MDRRFISDTRLAHSNNIFDEWLKDTVLDVPRVPSPIGPETSGEEFCNGCRLGDKDVEIVGGAVSETNEAVGTEPVNSVVLTRWATTSAQDVPLLA